MNTFNLNLATWDEGNTEPNLVFNALLIAMDALAQFTPEAITASPPGSPTSGQTWIIAASAIGVWVGKDQQVAIAVPGGWLYYPPSEGWEGYVKNLDANYQFDGTTWNLVVSGGGAAADVTYDNSTSGLSATDVQGAIDELAASSGGAAGQLTGINAQTGTTYTLVLADAGKDVSCNNAAAISVTIPPNSSVAFPIGTYLFYSQAGTGAVTAVAGSGVTLNPSAGAATAARYDMRGLVKVNTDEWWVL